MKQKYDSYGLSSEVTVFVSMIMMCLFALFCVLTESARTAGARWYLQMAANSALDSVFSQYHRTLWDSYRLFFTEYEKEEDLLSDFSDFLAPYLQVENWYPIEQKDVTAEQIIYAVDDHGKHFEKAILDYMKFGFWNLDFDVDTAGNLLHSGKEAMAVKQVAECYRGHAKEALKLEKALEAISGNLSEQMELKQEALSELHSYDESGFQKKANGLIREMRKIPGLVTDYRKKADRLAMALEESRKNCTEYRKDCTDSIDQILEDEIRQYEAYVSLDGERRQEIERLGVLSEEQILLVQEVKEDAEEVQQIIDDWEEDEEEDSDGPDLDSLWTPVIRKFDRIVIPSLSFSHGVKDKEKENWLNQVAEMYQNGMLALLIPEGSKISDQHVLLNELPSQKNTGYLERTVPLPDRLMVDEYCGEFFTCFTDTGGTGITLSEPVGPEDHALVYELEYLLSGKSSDEEALASALHQLLAIREGLNFIHILSDSTKRAEARNLAMTITGLAGVSPLVLVTTFFVMSVWALGESITDVRGLLAGKKVSLLKTAEDWNLGLNQLLEMGNRQDAGTGGGENGLGYRSWMKILLFLGKPIQQEYRMMDLIQLNLSRKQKNFRMKQMVYQVEIDGDFCGKHVFFSIPFVDKFTGRDKHQYSMEVSVQRVY